MIRLRWQWFVRHVLRRAVADDELDAEIRAHLALETERRVDAGESPDDAQRAARKEFGNILLVKEVTRDMWGWGFVERTWHDVRYSARGLVKSLAFTAVAVISLALGIAALEDEQGRRRYYAQVVILSHSVWQRRFGGDPGVIGDTLWLNDRAATIIGVMPAGFYYFRDAYPFWLPTPGRAETWRTFSVTARLAPGVTRAQAQVALDTLAARGADAFPETNQGWGVRLAPHHEFFTREFRPALLVLWGSVGFVLLIASANVAGVQLARASSRAQEIAMRLSLGASRWRVARLFLSEGVLLAVAGGAVGVLLAYGGVRTIQVFNPDANPALTLVPTFPRLNETSVDGRVLGYTILVSLATALLCSVAPALRGSRPDLNASLKAVGRGTASGSGRLAMRSVLIITQVALTLVLVTGAGLMARSMRNLEAVDLGFDRNRS